MIDDTVSPSTHHLIFFTSAFDHHCLTFDVLKFGVAAEFVRTSIWFLWFNEAHALSRNLPLSYHMQKVKNIELKRLEIQDRVRRLNLEVETSSKKRRQ